MANNAIIGLGIIGILGTGSVAVVTNTQSLLTQEDSTLLNASEVLLPTTLGDPSATEPVVSEPATPTIAEESPAPTPATPATPAPAPAPTPVATPAAPAPAPVDATSSGSSYSSDDDYDDDDDHDDDDHDDDHDDDDD